MKNTFKTQKITSKAWDDLIIAAKPTKLSPTITKLWKPTIQLNYWDQFALEFIY
jgi:hypothetical protein